MRIAIIPAIAACTAALIATALPAHADDQSFLNDLNQNHIGTGPVTDPVGMGHFICVQLRGGMSPADAAQMT